VIVGFKIKVVTVLPAIVTPQDAEYHFQFAPVPRLPPVTLNVVGEPEQIGVVPEAEVAAVERVFIVTEVLAQAVVLHVPSALT
jgi:hypothetical protein